LEFASPRGITQVSEPRALASGAMLPKSKSIDREQSMEAGLMNSSTRRKIIPLVLAVILLAGATQLLPGQGHDYLQSHYQKREFRISMRDGVTLFTAVYIPKDASRKYPIMLFRTPYSVRPYGEDTYPESLGPSKRFAEEGFIFALQDVRGRFMSEGEFVNMTPHRPAKHGSSDIDESTDTYDTIEWLVRNIDENNGRVGMWGISYPGFYAAAGMIDAHPALKAVSPQAPIADWFIGDDFHHNGALFLPHAFNFLAAFGRPRPKLTTEWGPSFDFRTPDGYSFYLQMGPLPDANQKYFKHGIAFWDDMMNHPNYDSFWQARNLRPHLKNIRPAVMTVGGWFDAEDLFGALNIYRSVERSSPGAYNILVMGPWSHGGWSRTDGESLGSVNFGSKTGAFFREEIEYPFFNHYLKDAGELKLPEAYVFETGRNQWVRYDSWPPPKAETKSLYFQSDGKLSWEPPSASRISGFDEYVSDPAKPVPYIASTVIGMTPEYMVADQRSASRRPDVLVYETGDLASDLVLAGPVIPSLQVSTTGTDSDWIVKLIDVYPDNAPDPQPNPAGVRMGGYQQLVRGEVMRGRFRDSYERPAPFVPGEVTRVEFTMPDVFHAFQKGHRVMIQIQSTWFPLVDRNPQKFVDIYNARPEDFQKATQRVYRSRDAASAVKVQVLPDN
jgi:putative CocE/NonD family hydrolase